MRLNKSTKDVILADLVQFLRLLYINQQDELKGKVYERTGLEVKNTFLTEVTYNSRLKVNLNPT